ncbi:hypothetical protein THIOM_002314 [Candidatus Thiomargarita nelsonii]|uniref:Lipoprotein n=1 Tax=Candidatus Thiomargarita nelsonii TaxID=1003181 RepID=A0A0A6RL82_9GAMM|nr:hypothetical protein THIOM_002314 [Candidatus Thiomargarita nelsonii]
MKCLLFCFCWWFTGCNHVADVSVFTSEEIEKIIAQNSSLISRKEIEDAESAFIRAMSHKSVSTAIREKSLKYPIKQWQWSVYHDADFWRIEIKSIGFIPSYRCNLSLNQIGDIQFDITPKPLCGFMK